MTVPSQSDLDERLQMLDRLQADLDGRLQMLGQLRSNINEWLENARLQIDDSQLGVLPEDVSKSSHQLEQKIVVDSINELINKFVVGDWSEDEEKTASEPQRGSLAMNF